MTTLASVYYGKKHRATVCHSNTVDSFSSSSVPGEISTVGSLCATPRHGHAGDGNGIVDALDDTEGEFGHPRSRARNEK